MNSAVLVAWLIGSFFGILRDTTGVLILLLLVRVFTVYG